MYKLPVVLLEISRNKVGISEGVSKIGACTATHLHWVEPEKAILY